MITISKIITSESVKTYGAIDGTATVSLGKNAFNFLEIDLSANETIEFKDIPSHATLYGKASNASGASRTLTLPGSVTITVADGTSQVFTGQYDGSWTWAVGAGLTKINLSRTAEYADDTAAGAGGVAVGEIYLKTGGILKTKMA